MSKKINVTWAHNIKVVNELHLYGLVNKTVKGRSKIITLTKKGRELAVICNKLISKHKESVINGKKTTDR